MKLIPRLFSGLLLTLLALPMIVQAQGDGTLHVLRPIIHAEQDKAELCLEFDHALDATDRGRAAMNIRLESNGKNIGTPTQNLSLITTMLCLPELDHHRDYRLTVSGLRGADNEKLADPYHLSFTVPDRHPSLAFVSDHATEGVIRWGDSDPLLHAINVGRVHIELYRISDPVLMAEAWKQRLQTSLAPSESAYFARNNGQLLWQGDIVLGDVPNSIVEQKVPLHAATGNLQPGLYLVVASAVVTKNKPTKDELAPLAAAWLLRSDLRIAAIRGMDGYYVTAEKVDASSVMKDVHLTIADSNPQILTEGKSDAEGTLFLPLPGDKLKNAAMLVGMTDDGNADFADLTQNEETHFIILPDLESFLTTDKQFYPPAGIANVTLTAHDRHGHATTPDGSRLQILRPDRSLYASLPISNYQDGVAHLSFPVPAGNGAWAMVWQQSDGQPLAESKLRITANEDAPHFEMSVDRALLSNDGAVDLTLKSLTNTNKPAPYITGQIMAAWATPEHIFPGWENYRFGDGDNKTVAAAPVASFITDENGAAQLHLNLTPPNDGGVLHATILSAQSDPAAGAADPAPLTLPLRPSNNLLIGIEPAAADGKFAENSLAHFDIIALDSDGKRRAADNLNYQLYEEGRSFDWYQAEGRWDYKPLQQHRRIGGGTLTLKADGANGIDWPVTAGTYRLEITDAAGMVRARIGFSAGWGISKTAAAVTAPLILTPATALQVAAMEKIRFRLDQPAMVSTVIADDHIRKILHQFKAAGDNDVTFMPDEDWGDNISVWMAAESPQASGGVTVAAGKILLPLSHGAKKLAAIEKMPAPAAQEPVPAVAVTAAAPPILKTGDTVQFTVNLKNNSAPAGSYRYALNSLAGLKVSGASDGTVALAAGQSRDLVFILSASQPGAQELKLEITGPRNVHLNSNWTIAVMADSLGLTDTVRQSIAPQQSWQTAVDKTHARAETGYLFVAPQPLFDLPQILAAALQTHSFTSREIAGEMESLRLWRDTIIQAGLLPEPKFMSRQHGLLMRMLSRQKPDGGFPPLPGSDADMASTATALTALASLDQPLAKTAADQAAEWLKHKLDNSWFDEAERPERAAAYAALALAGRLDPAALHYFADTSADKSLPPLAAAQLALALAISNDPDKAAVWLNSVPVTPDMAANLLPLLAENGAFDTQKLLPALEKLSGEILKKPAQDVAATAAFLRAMWQLQNRTGTWRVAVNNGEQNLKNVLVVAMPSNTLAFTIHNSTDKPLFLVEAVAAQMPATDDDGFARHIYRLNGNEMPPDGLHRDETYLMVVEGPWLTDNMGDTLVVRDHAGPALHPVSCALGSALETNESLNWLKTLSLTAPLLCEKSGDTVDALLERKDAGTKSWRIAYLVKPGESGTFSLTPTSVRNLSTHQDMRQGHADRIQIQ